MTAQLVLGRQVTGAERRRTGARRVATTSSWPTAIDAFEAYLEESLKRSTIDGYLVHLGWCAQVTGGNPWKVRAGQLVEWIDGRSWSKATRRLVVTTLRRFYAFGVAQGWCNWSPMAGISVSEGLRRGPQRNSIHPSGPTRSRTI